MNRLGFKTRVLNVPRGLLAHPWIERILYPGVRGGSPERSILPRLLPNHYQYPAGSIRRVEREGFQWELDLSDMMDWYLYWGLHDPSLEAYLSLLKQGQTVVDVGANNGRWALRASRIVGSEGAVHAIEPFPANARRLTRNLSLNVGANVRQETIAFGGAPGTVEMSRYDGHNLGTARVSIDQGEGVQVEVVPLDEWCAGADVGLVHVVKIDVEGYEDAVISGAEATLIRHRPLLYVEVSDENLREQGTSSAKLIASIERLGYRVEHALEGHRITADDALDGCFIDVIARP